MEKEKTVVIKIGSALMLDEKKREAILDVIEKIREKCQVVIVASGAVGFGREVAKEKGITTENEQALAALGQTTLMSHFETRFATAQVLLNHEDMSNGKKRTNAANAVNDMLNDGIVPVINENDTTSIEELKFGDNDQLSSHVAHFVEADQLFLLTQSEGVKDSKDQNTPTLDVSMLSEQTLKSFEQRCVKDKTQSGRGGILSKLIAAIRANQVGIESFIVDGRTPEVLKSLIEGDLTQVGTWTKIINQLSAEQITILEAYIDDKNKHQNNFYVPAWNYNKAA